MTSAPPPSAPGRNPRISPARVATWTVVAGIGTFLLISGVVGIVAKG